MAHDIAIGDSTHGPLTYGETSSATLPIDVMLTDASDRDAAMAALHSDLDGETATGFAPTRADGRIVVSFTGTVVHATRV